MSQTKNHGRRDERANEKGTESSLYNMYASVYTCTSIEGEKRDRVRDTHHSQNDYTPGTITVHNDPGGALRAPPPPANTPRSSTNPAAFHDHEYRERVKRATPPHTFSGKR